MILALLLAAAHAGRPGLDPALPVVQVTAIGDVDAPLGADLAALLGAAGVPIDTAPEEKERGITINTSHVEYQTEARRVAFFDPADETELVKTVLFDVADLDGTVLVVDAEAGITDGAEAAAGLADALGAGGVIVWLERSGLVDDKALLALEQATRRLLDAHGFDGDHTPIIRGSALGTPARSPKALWALAGAIDRAIALPPLAEDEPFLVPVEQVVRGPEVPVVLGTVEQGSIEDGAVVEVVGMGLPRLRAVVALEHRTGVVEAGDAAAVGLQGVDAAALVPGQVVAAPGTATPHTVVKAEVYVLKKEEGGRHTPFHNKYRPSFRVHGTDVTGEIELESGREMIALGDHGTITVSLIVPIAMDKGLRFAIREGGRTVGAGQVTEIVE